MSGRRRTLAASAALSAALGLAGCGIPTQPSASPISAAQVAPSLPASHPTVGPCTKSGCTPVDVYFLASGGRLRPIVRFVPSPPKIRTVVGALLGGPTPTEVATTHLGTALGSRIVLHAVAETSKKDTITLTFNGAFGTLSGTKWVLGVAQLVYTVVSVRPGAGVIFEIDGAQTEVPLQTGALWTGPVHESQYAALLTPASSAPSTP